MALNRTTSLFLLVLSSAAAWLFPDFQLDPPQMVKINDDTKPLPGVTIPGLTHSNLTYTIKNGQGFPKECSTNKGPTALWPPSLSEFHKLSDVPCYYQALKTLYNTTTKTFSNHPGETVTADYQPAGENNTFYNYTYATYDWRLPMDGLEAYYPKLKQHIETIYHEHNNTAVALIGPSWGAEVGLSFLHRMEQSWKDTYIGWFICHSPVWSGAPLALQGFISGIIAPESPIKLAALNRVLSTALDVAFQIFPLPGTSNNTWDAETVLVQTPNKNYTAHDAAQLLADLGFADRIEALRAVQAGKDLQTFDHPGVNTFVTYGDNLTTPEVFIYEKKFVANKYFVPKKPVRTLAAADMGDGYVPRRSSIRAWYDWKEPMAKAGHQLLYKGYPGQFHGTCTGNCSDDWFNLIYTGDIPEGAWNNLP